MKIKMDVTLDIKECWNCPIKYQAVCARCEPNELTQLEEIKYYHT